MNTHAQALEVVSLNREPAITIGVGEVGYVTIEFLLSEGYHIQADQVSDNNLIPTLLSLEDVPGIFFDAPIYPQAKEMMMKGIPTPLDVFNQKLNVKIPIYATSSVKQVVYWVKGKLRYQACDHTKCYFPRDFNFQLKLIVK